MFNMQLPYNVNQALDTKSWDGNCSIIFRNTSLINQLRATKLSLINWCFNIGSYIGTIYGANMNLEVSQYKNCWKWEHTTGVYRLQGARCIKCNGSYKLKHHCHFAWYCEANEKTNPPKLETKKGKPCLYTFRCLNCKGDY